MVAIAPQARGSAGFAHQTGRTRRTEINHLPTMMKGDGLTLPDYDSPMKAAPPVLAIPPKIFRHFAVVTIIITALVGIFADGENRQVVEDTIEQQRLAAQANQARMKQAEERRLAARANTRQVSVNGGGGGGGDVGVEVPVGDGGGQAARPPEFAFADRPLAPNRLLPMSSYRANDPRRPRALPPGMAPEDYHPDGDMSRRVGAPTPVTQQQYNTIIENSQRRSSAPTPDSN